MTTGDLARQFTIEYQDGDEPPVVQKGKIQLGESGLIDIVFEGRPPDILDRPSGILVPSIALAAGQDIIDRYSNIERDGTQGALIKALQMIEPRLLRLVVLTDGGAPRVWGDLGDKALLPVDQMGDGLARALVILTSIANARQGMVLIDEVENGIHHTALRGLWSHIAAFADTFDCQVFATTHSRECIEAAFLELSDIPAVEFVLQRLYRDGDSIRAEPYEGDKLAAALETGFEVR